jgi:hypothetical protein
VAVCPARARFIGAAGVQTLFTGSKISAALVAWPSAPMPPATRTRPSGSSVALWFARGVCIGNVSLKRSPAGLYRSADALTPSGVDPPLTSTRPSYSRVAAAPARPLAMSPAAAHVFDETAGAVARRSRPTAKTVAMARTNVTARLKVNDKWKVLEFRNGRIKDWHLLLSKGNGRVSEAQVFVDHYVVSSSLMVQCRAVLYG